METALEQTRTSIALGILLACCPCASALNPSLDINQYAHTAWTIRDGFFKGVITSVAQTPDGYLWLGTESGLLRFDGVRSVPWQPPDGENLPSTNIRSLLAARDGRLWIGTEKGLANWKDGKLTHYSELDGREVLSFLEDRRGTLWASGWASSTGRLCAIQSDSVQCYGEDGIFGRYLFCLYEDSGGNLWAGAEKGVWRWKPDPPKFYPMADPPNYLIEGYKGAPLLGTSVGIRQLVEGKAEPYPIPPGVGRQFRAARLFRERNGALWIGTDGGLLHVHQGGTDVFARSDGLSGDHIVSISEDREGNIWVATLDGLDRFRDFAIPTISMKQGLSNGIATSVLAARDGSVWLGTSDGLNRWNDGLVTIHRKRSAGLPDDNVESLFQDNRRRIWVSMQRGVAYLENGRFTPLSAMPGGSVHAMAGDIAGNLWIAHQDQGLFHFIEGTVVERIPWATLGRKDYGSALLHDPVLGGLWLGFWQGGVAYFKDGQVRTSYSSKDGLAEGRVAGFQLAPDGALWAATEGGLSRVKDGRVATLTSKNGLPCDTVHWVMEDDDHSFWLYMACGLVRLARADLDAWATDSKRTIQATVYDSSDGVRHRALAFAYSPRVARSADGKLWFTTFDGVSVIDPRNLPFNKLAPPVHIEQITADRKKHEPSAHLRLPALTRDLEIDYTALSLVAPEKVHFRYKLEGRDRDWKEVVNERKAFYTDLPPRHYRFHVIACNNSGVWNETGDALDFSIVPAYYQTNWFRALCAAAFLTMLWSMHYLRVRILKREQRISEQHQGEISALNERLMKAQEEERIRIAGELHDGVLQRITSLTLRLGTAIIKLPADSEVKNRIRESQKELMQVGTEIRHLSHELHPAVLQESGLPSALSFYCEEFSKVRGIPVSCEVDESVADLSPGAALCLYRIAQEALGNVAKHSQAKQADVRLSRSDGNVSLTVSDDGIGFTTGGKSGGLGLINMRERVYQLHGTFELQSEPGRGTKIKAAVPFRPAS